LPVDTFLFATSLKWRHSTCGSTSQGPALDISHGRLAGGQYLFAALRAARTV
jgi:hypothetical protein